MGCGLSRLPIHTKVGRRVRVKNYVGGGLQREAAGTSRPPIASADARGKGAGGSILGAGLRSSTPARLPAMVAIVETLRRRPYSRACAGDPRLEASIRDVARQDWRGRRVETGHEQHIEAHTECGAPLLPTQLADGRQRRVMKAMSADKPFVLVGSVGRRSLRL